MNQAPTELLDLIKRFEGFHKVVSRRPVVTAVPYICPAGYWTIGWGILCDKEHPPITLEQGDAMLLGVLPRYVGAALKHSPRLAAEPERRLAAIADFVFNLGPGRYAASTLRRRVNAGDWPGAAQEIGKWVWGGGRKLPGLVARRQAEAALLL